MHNAKTHTIDNQSDTLLSISLLSQDRRLQNTLSCVRVRSISLNEGL